MSKTLYEDTLNIEKLSSIEDYPLWKFQIEIIFKANNLHEIVISDTPEPTDKWKKDDAVAQKILISTIDKRTLLHILDCKTAYQMWTKIKTIFERDNEQQKCNLLQTFYNMSYDKGSDITTYISKLKNLTNRLNQLKIELNDNMVITKILVTLPEEYSHFASAWESTDMNSRTLENLTARLVAEEMRIKTKLTEEKEVALKTASKKCYKCNKIGHLSRDCKIKTNQTNKIIRCFRCNKTGHIEKQCKEKPHSKNTDKCGICKKTNHTDKNCFFRNNKKSKPEKEENMSFLVQKMKKEVEWIVDSGTTSNMINDCKNVKQFTKVKTKIGVAKVNESMFTEGTGSMEFQECNLKEVIYIPELSKNLLSVSKITDSGAEVHFTKEEVIVKVKDKVILRGKKLKSGLYQVKMELKNEEETHLIEKNGSKIEIWHRKLGHLGDEALKKLLKITEGIDLSLMEINDNKRLCKACVEAKHARSKFENTRTKATRPLQLIHTDLCGPFDPITWDGNKYFITFLDDYTHYTMVYLLKSKAEAADKIKEYVSRMETRLDKKVAKIRCDNGREYVNDNIKNWCKRKGIELNTTIPYTPQLNGKAERLNRTLVEKIRALLFDSKMNKEMWGEALYVATYLLNRSPTETLKVTPFEMLENKRPKLNNLQVFGLVAYAKVLGPLKKLDNRSKKFRFVGYAPNGYRLWNEDRRKIIVARDVKFETEIKKDIDEESREISLNQLNKKTEDSEEEREESDNDYRQEEEEDTREEEELNKESLSEEDQENEVEEIRKSTRSKRKPERFKDYVCNKFKDYAYLTYNEAIKSEDKENWKIAIAEEKQSLKENNVWVVVDENQVFKNKQKPLHSKWVFTIKPDGKYKARLVIKGCEQKNEMDYQDTYSPVIGQNALRSILAIAAAKQYKIISFDVKTAFLYGELEEDVYMYPPEGYNYKRKILKLKKALYGLKQAPLRWNIKFTDFLKEKGFIPLKSEQCLFKRIDNDMILSIYVDDGLLIGSNTCLMDEFLKELNRKFKIKIDKNTQSYVGLELCKSEENVILKQKTYINKILQRSGMECAKPVKIPILKGERAKTISRRINYPYREIIGSLLYASTKTRPDIAYAVNYASRYVENPMEENINDVKHILKYLKGNNNVGIEYKKKGNIKILEAYSDADFAGDPETRKSTSGYIIFFGGGPISWSSRKQTVIAQSTTEAEYVAAAECCKELMYLKSLLEELLNDKIKICLNMDSQSAMMLIKNGIINKKSKHIEVRYHYIHDLVKKGIITLNYCPTAEMLADILTKPLNTIKFKNLKDKILKEIKLVRIKGEC